MCVAPLLDIFWAVDHDLLSVFCIILTFDKEKRKC